MCRSALDEVLVRRLQYRLQRQGMLELDAWLSPLTSALQAGDTRVVQAVACLLSYEVPDLLAMQTGTKSIPEELRPWLNILS